MATQQNTPKPQSKTSVQVGLDAVLVIAFVVLAISLFAPQVGHEWLTVAPLIGGAAIAILTAFFSLIT
ncbi:hypothetical protein [Halorientalis salina]|uniref:hypothetical protein n=1 Tax=Halorientalis salina TaxID=2932266 RepID=UPI0010AC7C7E|nr:hypothetical protein [Halorientalis salina]